MPKRRRFDIDDFEATTAQKAAAALVAALIFGLIILVCTVL